MYILYLPHQPILNTPMTSVGESCYDVITMDSLIRLFYLVLVILHDLLRIFYINTKMILTFHVCLCRFNNDRKANMSRQYYATFLKIVIFVINFFW